ncbi:hypothetical protein M409DRAFT_59018 [Zasmidium cellare ATCC 36951]|uniref:Uncharacterized protein n=1 Tax=Zasmidium cellare ATCC 36951 TaxID=1080233 RepID=A0A6A6C3F6_ZASCE|nr:uncharacterized protein M409DRAFT_59018 [Zasmidium cellare ATCC 36951]KAF2161634.1 hypothetical protein M409DRAFT_59018 [Zasmidium cellare ATCC 36951]
MLAGLVVGIILGVVAACILIAIMLRYFDLRKRRKTTQIFHVPPSTSPRSLGSPHYSGFRTPAMAEVPPAIPVVPHAYQNFASEIPAPFIPEAEPTTPLSDMFSPYTNTTTPFSDLVNPIIRDAAAKKPQVSDEPNTAISRRATELQLTSAPPSPVSPMSQSSSRPFSPLTVSSARESICETPVVKTAVALNVSRESLHRTSMYRIDNEQSTHLQAPETAFIPYRSPQQTRQTEYFPYRPPQE